MTELLMGVILVQKDCSQYETLYMCQLIILCSGTLLLIVHQ